MFLHRNKLHYAIIFLLFNNFIVNGYSQNKIFKVLNSAETGIAFRNDIVENSSMFYYINEYLYNGGGVSVGDINNDGLQDIYFTSTLGENKLYLNQGNFIFKDITKSAGVGLPEGIKTGVVMVDINQDGYLDIYVSRSGSKNPSLRKNVCFINNKDLTFTDKSSEIGLDDPSFTIQTYFFDYDLDGDLDAYMVNHPGEFKKSMTVPVTQVGDKLVYAEDTSTYYVSDRLYENANGKFEDVTKRAGLFNHAFGLSASIGDFNSDGWPDIYVANDFNKPDQLFINNQDGTYSNQIERYFRHLSFFSMGSDFNDINNDGLEDLLVLDMAVEDPVRKKQLFSINQNYDKFQLMVNYGLYFQYPRNVLQLNRGDGTFSDIAYLSGIAETDWSWAPLIFDMDNDGFKDIYITNGLKRDITDWDYKEFVLDSIMKIMQTGKSVDLQAWLNSIPTVPVKNYIYKNTGTLKFENFTDIWSDIYPTFSSGAAYADLDNDGDLDIITNNVDGEALVLRNEINHSTNAEKYLRFKFFKSPAEEVEKYGVEVKLYHQNGKIQFQRYYPQRGFLSSMEHILHFGIGRDSVISLVEVNFNKTKQIRLENVKSNQTITLYESDSKLVNNDKNKIIQRLFTIDTSQLIFKYKHEENEFIDFKREPLLPYINSQKGPYYAISDVNGDKLEDLFIGGASGIEGKLFIQQTNGFFKQSKQQVFTNDKKYEDNGVLFFDIDSDNDQDLLVVSGGYEFSDGNEYYQDRIYFNDGTGNFSKSNNVLPDERCNGSVAVAFDFDNDSDLDLFVGGHVFPGKYPKSDQSIFYKNENGIFKNITAELFSDNENFGIINSALWLDMDGNGINELVVSGDWNSVRRYEFMNDKFKIIKSSIKLKSPINNRDTIIDMDNFKGMWNVMKSMDVNNDGKLDLVLGNKGLNSMVKGNLQYPVKVYAKDFDHNGSYDAVLGYFIHGKCYPMFSRDQLIDQMPAMRKRFVRYKHYSGKTLDDLFTDEEKLNMDVYTSYFYESGVLLNEGNQIFRFLPLPDEAQFSTIHDFAFSDFDGDGVIDMILTGNSDEANVMIGVSDANPLLMLKGKGDGNFNVIEGSQSGLIIQNAEVKKIINLFYNNNNRFLMLLKNKKAIVFK